MLSPGLASGHSPLKDIEFTHEIFTSHGFIPVNRLKEEYKIFMYSPTNECGFIDDSLLLEERETNFTDSLMVFKSSSGPKQTAVDPRLRVICTIEDDMYLAEAFSVAMKNRFAICSGLFRIYDSEDLIRYKDMFAMENLEKNFVVSSLHERKFWNAFLRCLLLFKAREVGRNDSNQVVELVFSEPHKYKFLQILLNGLKKPYEFNHKNYKFTIQLDEDDLTYVDIRGRQCLNRFVCPFFDLGKNELLGIYSSMCFHGSKPFKDKEEGTRNMQYFVNQNENIIHLIEYILNVFGIYSVRNLRPSLPSSHVVVAHFNKTTFYPVNKPRIVESLIIDSIYSPNKEGVFLIRLDKFSAPFLAQLSPCTG